MLLNEGAAPDKAFLGALSSTLADESLDPAFVALVLALPSEDDLAQAQVDAGLVPDPQAIHAVRERMRDAMAEALEDQLRAAYAAHQVRGPYRPDADAAASRALANTALMLLSRSASSPPSAQGAAASQGCSHRWRSGSARRQPSPSTPARSGSGCPSSSDGPG